MKNKKDQKDDRSPTNQHQQHGKQWEHQGDIPSGQEGGRGANKNDDRSEDSKGGGNRGLGN